VNVPQAPEAEAAICSVLLEPGSWQLLESITKDLSPDDFHDPAHREIYRSIRLVNSSGVASDKPAVVGNLRTREKLELVGGPAAVKVDITLSNDPVTIRAHVEAIIDARRKRDLLRLARDTAVEANNGKPSAEIIGNLRSHIDRLEVRGDVDRWEWTSQELIFARDVPPIAWDVDQLLERNSGPAIFFGEPESFKSWLALHLSACMVTGEPPFGHFKTSPRPRAPYLNLDAGARAFERRVQMLGSAIPALLIASPREFNLDRFREALEKNAGGFVVVDTFADMYSPDPNVEQGADMRAFVRSLRALFEKNDCSGLLLDHTNRSSLATPERYYGSVQKKGAIRQMIAVERVRMPEERRGRARVKLSCAKMSEAERFAPFLVDLEWTETLFRAHYAGEADEASNRAALAVQDAEIIVAVLTKAAGPMSRTEIEAATDLSRDRIRAVLQTDNRIEAIGPIRSPKRRYFLRTMVAELDLGDDSCT
jgi:AAA domain-containing protein/DnaB helicase-like protein